MKTTHPSQFDSPIHSIALDQDASHAVVAVGERELRYFRLDEGQIHSLATFSLRPRPGKLYDMKVAFLDERTVLVARRVVPLSGSGLPTIFIELLALDLQTGEENRYFQSDFEPSLLSDLVPNERPEVGHS